MIKVIINGANGKMGGVVAKTVGETNNLEVVCGFDIAADGARSFPVFTDYNDFKGKADVIIDFSHPSALESILNYATAKKTPIVVATTGLSKEQKDRMADASKIIPLFFSANMSLGINLLIDLACKASAVLSENFDIEIEERHHNQKIDAPSGTALMIADAINKASDKDFEYIYDRHVYSRKRKKNEIGIHAVRGGTIVGEHTVLFAGNDEMIELKHTAASKEVFATGAVAAAKFLVNKLPGIYSMSDLVSDIK